MEAIEVIPILMSCLRSFAAFAVLVAALVVVFVLWRRKEGGTAGALLFSVARTGVWLFTFGVLILDVAGREMAWETVQWTSLAFRTLLLLSTMMTVPALLLIRTKEA